MHRLMKCGHSDNATCGGAPSCAICGCDEVAEAPDLVGREARCGHCGRKQASSLSLAFFEYRPDGSAPEDVRKKADAAFVALRDFRKSRGWVAGNHYTYRGMDGKYDALLSAWMSALGECRADSRYDSYYCGCRGWD